MDKTLFEFEKQEILNAIKAKDYKVYISEPENIQECTHPDGTTFYVISGCDDCKSSIDFGYCSVTVRGHEFCCDLEYGTWSCDDDKDQVFVDDEEIIDAIEELDDVMSGICDDCDAQMCVYAAANNLNIDELEYYFSEQDDCPPDVEDITDIEECKDATVTYKGEDYYIIQGEDDDQIYAVKAGTIPDNYGRYKCVVLTFENGTYTESEEAIGAEEADCVYNPDTYSIE